MKIFVSVADSVLTEDQLIDAGVKHSIDRKAILSAFYQYTKLRTGIKKAVSLTELEPSSSTEATAPVLEHSTSISATECVVCMDMEVRSLYLQFDKNTIYFQLLNFFLSFSAKLFLYHAVTCVAV